MSKLSKFGDFLKILAHIGPLILALNPATAPIAGIVVAAIAEAEALHGASGKDKKRHVVNIVTPVVALLHEQNVKGFENPALVLDTMSVGIDTVVGAVKIVAGTKKAVDVTPSDPAVAPV